jgi:hypothetical protein
LFSASAADAWDRQIERDVSAGRLHRFAPRRCKQGQAAVKHTLLA